MIRKWRVARNPVWSRQIGRRQIRVNRQITKDPLRIRWNDGKCEFELDDGYRQEDELARGKRPASFSRLMRSRTPMGQLTQRYKEAIDAREFESAIQIFDRIAEHARPEALSVYVHDAMRHVPTLRMKEQIARRALGHDLPAETVALLLHYWCQETRDVKARDDNIKRLCWEATKRMDLREILHFENIMASSERAIVANIVSGVPAIAIPSSQSLDNSGTFATDLKNPLDTELPGLEEVFGSALVDSCRVDGAVNYMDLYDTLDEQDQRTFENMYEAFNKRRQAVLEGIEDGHSSASESAGQKSWIEKTLLDKWSAVAADHVEGLFAGEDRAALGKEFHNSIVPYIKALAVAGSDAIGIAVARTMLDFALEHGSGLTYDPRDTVSHLTMVLGREVEERVLRTIRRRVSGPLSEPDLHHLSSEFLWRYESLEPWIIHDRAYVGAYFVQLALRAFKVSVTAEGQLADGREDQPRRESYRSLEPAQTLENSARQQLPAFWRTYTLEYGSSHVVGVVKVAEAVKDLVEDHKMRSSDAWVSDSKLPLLVRPRPWTSYGEGGYLYRSLGVQTSMTSEQASYHAAAINGGRMQRVLAALHAVGGTAWAVNRDVLRVVTALWDTGEEVGSIPGIPEPVTDETLREIEQNPRLSPDEAKFRKRQAVTAYRDKKTVRTVFGTVLSAATKLGRRGDRFYFAQQMDFRGRMYPVSPTGLSYVSHDAVRGLLQFWHGRQLGPDGWHWLKVHLANVYGFDKAPNSERAEFADAHMDDIRDSAVDPLGGRRWWLTAGKPFQTLAACFEIHKALESGNPHQYVSRLAVNQDGTCNGLQHYSALVRDRRGAAQVNMVALAPGQGRTDIYTEVLRLVEDRVARDAAQGNDMARHIAGKITRGVVKQSVMTKVYGVTPYGILKQVERNMAKDAPQLLDHRGNVAAYVQHHLRAAIDEMFAGATALQEWLMECAHRVTESVRPDLYPSEAAASRSPRDFLAKFYTTLAWTSPLGLTVAQPYRAASSLLVRTPLQTVSLRNAYRLTPVARTKQVNGVSPNFVHTLDAAHMMLTALACESEHVAFAAVHDSFWTHAATVPFLSRALREQFVALYAADPLAALDAELRARYAGHLQCVYVPPNTPAHAEITALRTSYHLTPEPGQSRVQAALRHELSVHRAQMDPHHTATPTPLSIIRKHNQPVYYRPRGASKDTLIPYTDTRGGPSIPSAGALRVLVPLVIPSPPPKGDLNINDVLSNPYFFS